jgi:hypothetical protein
MSSFYVTSGTIRFLQPPAQQCGNAADTEAQEQNELTQQVVLVVSSIGCHDPQKSFT